MLGGGGSLFRGGSILLQGVHFIMIKISANKLMVDFSVSFFAYVFILLSGFQYLLTSRVKSTNKKC